jgi:hypothetical protein
MEMHDDIAVVTEREVEERKSTNESWGGIFL